MKSLTGDSRADARCGGPGRGGQAGKEPWLKDDHKRRYTVYIDGVPTLELTPDRIVTVARSLIASTGSRVSACASSPPHSTSTR